MGCLGAIFACLEADHFSRGRHEWPMAQLAQWLRDSGYATVPDGTSTTWAKVMKGSGVANVTEEDVQDTVLMAETKAKSDFSSLFRARKGKSGVLKSLQEAVKLAVGDAKALRASTSTCGDVVSQDS